MNALEAAGTLIPYVPRVRAPTLVTRKAWLAKDALLWLEPPGKHPEGIKDEALVLAKAQLNNFVWGKYMEERQDLKHLYPYEKEVWEVKQHLHRQQLRLFGWFPRPNMFVVIHGKRRDALEPKSGPKWDKAIQRVVDARRELMGTDVTFGGFSYGDYIN